jgi:O-antigen ligase
MATLFLLGGLSGAILFVLAMAATPILHSTAPYLIRIPVLDIMLAPSGRMMTWTEALRTFSEFPIFGQGIGINAVNVQFESPSGMQRLGDAHNGFLNIAAQCGLVGLAAFLALVVHIWRRAGPFRLPASGPGILRLGAGLALLNGLVYQGLGGSFEDARHIWAVFGLLLAAARIEKAKGRGMENENGR